MTNNVLEPVKRHIDKLLDGNDVNKYVAKHILDMTEEQANEIQEYANDRVLEIEQERNKSGLDYPLYDHSAFKVASKSWQELNPDGLSYWHWLIDIGLPEFWIQPRPDLQYKLLSICSAINTNAIPPRNKGARRELPVPLLYFYGQSGSGKTEGNFIISQSYPSERFQIIKAEATGTSLRNVCHQLCYRGFNDTVPGYNNLFPAFLLIDNYEPAFLQRWGEFKTVLLSVLRTQSFTTTANQDRENDYFYTHLLKSFTSVIPPKAMNTAQSEFGRRFIYFFTEKCTAIKSIAIYDFSDVPEEYAKLWNTARVYATWYDILKEVLSKDDNSTTVPPARWSQSMCIIAVGTYINVFSCVDEGIEFMTEYWAWVKSLEDDMTNEISTLIDSIVHSTLQQWVLKWLDNSNATVNPDDPLTLPFVKVGDVSRQINSGILSKKQAFQDAKDYLQTQLQWSYTVLTKGKASEFLYYCPYNDAIKLAVKHGMIDEEWLDTLH